MKLQQPAQAIADYNEALKLAPQKARALFGRGIARRNIGDKTGAEADFAAAKAAQSDIADEVRRFGVTGS